MPEMKEGLVGIAETEVTDRNTAAALGNKGVNVFATPFMVALMEEACRNAVAPHLPPGFVTLGGHVDLKHLAPTPKGFKVKAEARLAEVKGPKLVFDVKIDDGIEPVGQGRHVRFMAPESEFRKRASAKEALRPGKA